MTVLSKEELKKVSGGLDLTGTLLNSFTSLIKVLLDAGRAVGSSLRRIEADAMCPLK